MLQTLLIPVPFIHLIGLIAPLYTACGAVPHSRSKSLFERVHVSFHLLVRRLAHLPISALRGSKEVRQVLSVDVVAQNQLVEL
jgi:hypothetical protein